MARIDTGEEAERALRLLVDKYEQYRREPPGRPVLGVDISTAALDVVRRNAIRLGLDVEFRLGDLLPPARDTGPFGVVVANLPYVDATEWPALPVEVRGHEPRVPVHTRPPGHRCLSVVETVIAPSPARGQPTTRGAFSTPLGENGAEA